MVEKFDSVVSSGGAGFRGVTIGAWEEVGIFLNNFERPTDQSFTISDSAAFLQRNSLLIKELYKPMVFSDFIQKTPYLVL